MEKEWKGRLSLEINEAQTEAALLFEATLQGETWTREKVIGLLREEGLIENINPLSLEKALATISEMARGKERFVVALGVPPQITEPGSIQWDENPVPETITAAAERQVAGLPDPIVYEWHDEQTDPQKKAKRRQQAATQGSHLGYIRARTRVATLVMSKPGIPGRTVLNTVIPAAEAAFPAIYYSEGFVLKGDKLYALEDGILRIGENWVELVPFTSSFFELKAVENGSDCLLSFVPGNENQPSVSAADVLKAAVKLGFTRSELYSAEKISIVLREAWGKKSSLSDYSLCRPVDSFIGITVSPDKLFALLTLHKERGKGAHLALAAISERIKKAGLKQMDIPQVRQDVLAFFNDPKRRELADYELARGTLPGGGENGSLEWEVSFSPSTKKAELLMRLEKQADKERALPSLKEFPLAEIKELAAVIPEQKLARIVPSLHGKPGTDVFGKSIEGSTGEQVIVKCFEHVEQYGLYYISKIRGIFEYGKKDDAFLLRVRPHQDGECSIEITDDGMQAFLTIIPHTGVGEPISYQKVIECIKAEGITAGVKLEALKDVVAAAQGGQAVNHFLIAEGREPIHVEDVRFVVKLAKPEKKRVRILSDGRADYKSVSNIQIVNKGDLVAEIIPSIAEPKAGLDVLGRPIPAKSKSGTTIPELVNLRRVKGEKGIIRLYAEVDGEFVRAPTAAGIRRLHLIPGDVGLETGNINFPGSVLVAGSVQAGFSVFSKGDIMVKNLVEEALLSAEGSITIDQGVKGSKNAILRSKGAIDCLFAENAFLLTVGDITIERSSLNCTIKCNGKLTIGRTKGTLMGGVARAKKGVSVINLGSPSEVKTMVSIGQDYLLGDQIEKEEKELEKLKSQALDIDRAMGKKSADTQTLVAMREDKLRLLKMIEKHNLRLFTLRERFEEHFPAQVVVRGTVHPGVTIESHGRLFHVKQEQTGVRYTFNSKTGTIEESVYLPARGKTHR